MVTSDMPAPAAADVGRFLAPDFREREPARFAGGFGAIAGAALLCALAETSFFLPDLCFLDLDALAGLVLSDLAIESLMPSTEAFADERSPPGGFPSGE